MIIRPATIQDARRLSYLIRRNAEMVAENGYTEAQKKAWSDQNKVSAIKEKVTSIELFCALMNDRLVGTIGLDGTLVCGMYVSHSKRGHGIGQRLLDHLEIHARKKNIAELQLTASPNGYGFYLKNGFEPYGPIELQYDDEVFMETKMRKQL